MTLQFLTHYVLDANTRVTMHTISILHRYHTRHHPVGSRKVYLNCFPEVCHATCAVRPPSQRSQTDRLAITGCVWAYIAAALPVIRRSCLIRTLFERVSQAHCSANLWNAVPTSVIVQDHSWISRSLVDFASTDQSLSGLIRQNWRELRAITKLKYTLISRIMQVELNIAPHVSLVDVR